MALGDDLIDDAEGSGILGRQEIVAVEGLFDRGVVLAGVADIDLVQAPLHLDDVLGMALEYRWPDPRSRPRADATGCGRWARHSACPFRRRHAVASPWTRPGRCTGWRRAAG